jgi:ligand-binding sensor domain-containing protein/two-component sensor histidine kinase
LAHLFSIVLSFTCLLATAQYSSISFNNISLTQGLSQSSVVDVSFDAKGFVWLATQDGLNRYDGKNFLVLDKKFDDITSGSVSRLGKVVSAGMHSLWIISKGGQLEKLDLIDHSFKSFAIVSNKNKEVITCLLPENNEKVWLGTASGKIILYDFKHEEIIREINVPPTNHSSAINALFKDSRRQLWVIGSTVSVLRNGGLVSQLVTGSEAFGMSIIFSCMAEDGKGKLWLGTLGAGLLVNKANGNFERFTGDRDLIPSDLVIEDILADADGRIWVGTYGKGLFTIDENEKNIQQYINEKKNPYSLAFNDVLKIKQDVNKGIWIGTDGGGVSYYNKNRNNVVLFTNETVPQNVEIAMVRSIATNKKGTIWAGTSNTGLTQIDQQNNKYKTWHFPSYKKSIYNPDRIVSLLADDEGVLWLGTQGNGLILFDPVKEKIKKWFHPEAASEFKIPDGTAWCIYPKSGQEVWIGTESSGLCLFNKRSADIGSYVSNYKPRQNTDAIRCITAIDDSTLCVGFAKTGVLLFNTKTKAFLPIKSQELQDIFTNETTIKSLYYHNPFLWIGTGGNGLVVVDLVNAKCTVFTSKDGLPNNTIYGMLPDAKGNLWVSTNKGISRFSKNIIHSKPQPFQFTNYTAAHGLQSNEFNTGAYCKAANDALLFGGITGLNVFDPSAFDQLNKSIPVVFTQILVDNETANEDSGAPYKKTVSLSYKSHSIAFTFAALNFSSLQQYHYYYKLEGYDEDWINADQRNYVSYTNIPPGQYNFQVKYVMPGNISPGSSTAIGIVIIGPFYKTWWFISLIVVLVVGLIYTLYRYRLSQVLKLFQVRQSIATDLHDDIGSTLTNISILSELSKKSLENPAQAHTFLSRISEEVHASSQSLDDIIWSVNTNNDTWEETFSRMRRYAAEVFDNSSITYNIKLDEQAGRVKLNMEKRRDVFLIYKELLNNIHKHAAATEVWIDMHFKEQKLIMDIRDNGKGFNKIAQTHRNGLKNLNLRVSHWHGSIDINTGNEGTNIRVAL